MIIEISTPDHESYWRVNKKHLKEVIKLTPDKADAYIRKNCKPAVIHNTEYDVDRGFASNCEKWEWEEFVNEIEEYLEG